MFADFHDVKTPIMAHFKPLNTEFRREVHSWYEPAPAPTGGDGPGLGGHLGSLLQKSTDMPILRGRNLDPISS